MSTPDPQPPISIRARSDYDSLKEDIDKHGAEHEKDTDKLWQALEALRTEAHVGRKELADRISALERWQWFCYGLSVAVGALATHVLKGLGLKNE